MRELARVRTSAARVRNRPGGDAEAIGLLDDALQLLDLLRIECAGLQQRCTELERTLAACDERTRKLLDGLPQPIVTTDTGAAIVDANRAACRLLARSRAKLRSELLLHFSEDRLAFSNVIREVSRANDPLTTRLRLRPNERAPFDASVTVYKDFRADGPQFVWLLTPEDPRP